MSERRRLLVALITILSPLAAPVYLSGHSLSHAPLSTLPLVGAIILGSLALALAAALVGEPFPNPGALPRLKKAAFGNVAFIFFDLAVFALLVYGQHFSAHKCETGPACELYPVMWLALAGMHFCYAAVGGFIKLRSERTVSTSG
jgi:hypothetical protein